MKRQTQRGGFTITECLIAMTLLGAVTLALVPAARTLDESRRSADSQWIAAVELSNQMEQIIATSARQQDTDVTSTAVEQIKPSPMAAQSLPDARLTGKVDEVSSEGPLLGGRRVTLEIDWLDRAGRRTAPARLVAWLAQPAEEN